MKPQTHRLHSREALVSPSPIIDPSSYIHSPTHYAVACKDYAGLRRIISSLPKPAATAYVRTERDAIAEETKAEALSAVIDRRDVPSRETPLHLAVRLRDITAAQILMSSGADCSLQNEQGWSALQEAICARQDAIAKIIIKYYQPLAWAKWCRRLPRIIATMKRMRDFYMEVSFNFESSVIPLIGRAAPSDTYRIWKRGPNLRADMTLSGFDGFKIQRSGQTFLFLGEGSDDGTLPAGSLCVLDHKSKEVTNALEGADKDLTDSEVAQEVALMVQTNLYRPGIDVTQAILVPQLSWMWQEKVETVHGWKAKVYDMHNVMLSVKSRGVPGAMTDEEFLQNLNGEENNMGEDYLKMLTEEEKKHKGKASTSRNVREDGDRKHKAKAHFTNAKDGALWASSSTSSAPNPNERKGWFNRSRKGEVMNKTVPPRSSLSSEKKVGDLLVDGEEEHPNKASRLQRGRRSTDAQPSSNRDVEETFVFVNDRRREPIHKSRVKPSNDGSKVNEFKKGLRPALWLTPDFPLKTEELVPLLDILASKVKAVRRLQELLTTKLPPGTFPVKIALPVVPTIRVIITFSKFEELQTKEEFVTPPSSPDKRSQHEEEQHQSSWLSWIKGPATKVIGSSAKEHVEEESNPFAIPNDYMWTSLRTPKKGKKGATKS